MINKKVFVFLGIVVLILLVLSFTGTDFLSFLNQHNLLIKDFVQEQPQYSKIIFLLFTLLWLQFHYRLLVYLDCYQV